MEFNNDQIKIMKQSLMFEYRRLDDIHVDLYALWKKTTDPVKRNELKGKMKTITRKLREIEDMENKLEGAAQ